jgi:hypothetical protein
MCAALVFSTEGREIVVTAMDNEFFVGEYASTNPEWDHAIRSWKSVPLYRGDELKGAIELEALVEECASTVTKFVRNLE